MSMQKSGAASPVQADVWEVDLNPTLGREQAGIRPALIVSDNSLNSSQRDLVVVVPIAGTNRGFPTHIPVNPREGGLTKPSVIMTEHVRSISKARLIRRLGVVSGGTMNQVKQTLRIVLDL
jgi:mRNA interferase MazF